MNEPEKEKLLSRIEELEKRIRELESQGHTSPGGLPIDRGRLYESIFRLSPTAIGITKFEDGSFVEYNDALCRYMGYSRQELEGGSTLGFNFYHDQSDRDQVKKMLLENGTYYNREFQYRDREGQVLHGLQSAELIEIGGEKFIISETIDVTEFKKIEKRLRTANDEIEAAFEELFASQEELNRNYEELQDSEAKYRYLVENMNDIIYQIDREGRILYISPNCEALLGYNTSELLNTNIIEYVMPEEKTRVLVNIDRVNGEDNEPIIYRVRKKNGEPVWIEASARPIYRNREFIGAQGIATNISHRRIVEEELKKSESRLRQLIESAPIGIAISQHGSIRYVNRACLDIFGFSEEGDLINRELFSLIAPEYRSEVLERNRRRETGGEEVTSYDSLGVRSNGSFFPIHIDASSIELSDGTSTIIFLSDITAREAAATALRLSEERYRLLFQQSPLGIFQFDRNLAITECNSRFVDILKTSRQNLIGLDLNRLQDTRVFPAISNVLNGETGLYEGPYMATTSTTTVIISLHTSPLYHMDGSVSGGIGIVEDITERKKTEEMLTKERTVLNDIISLNPYSIAITDRNGYFTKFNNALVRIFGFQPSDRYCFFKDRILLEAGFEPFFKRLREGDTVYLPELWYNASAIDPQFPGRELCLLTTIFPIKNAEGSIENFVIMHQDITQRKRAEQELLAEKDLLAITMRSIGDGVITTDTEGRVILMNRVAEQLTGWRQEECEGKDLDGVLRLFNALTHEPLHSPALQVLARGYVSEISDHTLLTSRGGREQIIAIGGAPVIDGAGGTIGTVLVFRDTTEKHKMELEMQKNQRLESIGLLAGGIAHDFNNILAAIVGNISLARMFEVENKTVIQILSEAENAAFRARDLTQQLLTFSRGGMPIKQYASIPELIKESAAFILRGSKVGCNFSFAPELWVAEVDTGQVSQVIQNLIINAEQAMQQGGEIEISAENSVIEEGSPLQISPGRYVMIAITDHGTGIPQENLQIIFDPYFTTKETGSGLGLSIAHSIVKKHNGTITVESESGTGSTFRIYLPATDAPGAAANEIISMRRGIRAKILLMDDEEGIRTFTGQLLRKLGHEVITAEDGEEAVTEFNIAAIEGHPYDVIILDLTVPGGMGGLETLNQIKEKHPNIKAIVSSGYSNDPIMADYRQYGFSGVLSKPYRIHDLEDIIEKVITGEE